MPDPIRNKLAAYLDGELDRRGQIEVEAHLETCQECRAEMEELNQLSRRLRAAPQPEFTPALAFKAQIMLQLPRRAPLTGQSDPLALYADPSQRLLPWLAPGLVLAGWVFIQVTLGLSTVVLLVSQSGLLGGALAWAATDPQQMQWISITRAALGGMLNLQGQESLYALNDAGLFAQNVVMLLLWQVGLAIFYWGGLSLVWNNKVKTFWTSLTAG